MSKKQFFDTYRMELRAAVQNYPQEYVWTIDQFETVLGRMLAGFERGSFNKDSRAIKSTCKLLGIKHTYKAINEFISKGD